ncbi:MAG: fused MFS/spermidine synthase, partial [Candidatus Latescibacterota bacterium]
MSTLKTELAPTLPALFLIGFSSVIAQIVLMRELIVVYNGNEISMGIVLSGWLLWTALGSGLFGKIAHRLSSPRKAVAVLEMVLAVAFPAAIVAVRASRSVFDVTPGEILGPGPMFVTTVTALGVLCLTSGALFAAGSRLRAAERSESEGAATGSVYLLEAVGSGVGGIVAGLLLIRVMSSSEIALIVSIFNLFAAWSLTGTTQPSRAGLIGGLVAASILWMFGSHALENVSNRILWRGFDVVDIRNSVYGNLVVTAAGESRSVYDNGKVLFTIPNQEAAEEAVHYALLQHEYPRNLLLVGGGINGGLTEALRHKAIQHIDYVELDPMLLDIGEELVADQWSVLEASPRVDIHNIDGRLFLKRTKRTYDVIVFNLPDPQTAQVNRFYSIECFEDAAARLAPGGLLSFKLTGAENYVSDDLARFLRCINNTVRAVFPRVMVLPGATIHFFATVERGATTSDSNVLLHRLRARGIKTQYVNESFLPFRMTPDRMDDLRTRIEPAPGTPVNRDFEPVAYFFNVALWSTQFHQAYKKSLDALAGVDLTMLAAGLLMALVLTTAPFAWRLKRGRQPGECAGYGVAVMGFTTIGLEVLLLLGFQAIYGYVY